jgi:hypothetical protein
MGSNSSCGWAGLRFLRGRERIGASASRRRGLDLGGFFIASVQQKNLKDTVTIPTCPRNSHKGSSAARGWSEKNLQASIALIPMGILLIPNVQDNIPILQVA